MLINIPKSISLLSSLWKVLPRRRKLQFYALLIVMILASLFELLSLITLFPFLNSLVSSQAYNSQANVSILHDLLYLFRTTTFEIQGITLIFFVLCSGFLRILLLYLNSKISFGAGADISAEIYRKNLGKNYQEHLKKNSAELISAITIKTDDTADVLMLSAMFISSFLIVLVLTFTLLAISTFGTLFLGFIFTIIYFLIIKIIGKKLLLNGNVISSSRNLIVKVLQESFHGIRDVILNNSQFHYYEIYTKNDSNLRKSQASNVFLTESPRYILESIGISLMIFLVILLNSFSNSQGQSLIPIIGVLSLGSLRLLPSLQYCFRSYAIVSGNIANLEEILNLLKLNDNKISYHSKNSLPPHFIQIKLEQVSFKYDANKLKVFSELNLIINPGEHIGIIGETGVGKSTLVDLISGLLTPTEGKAFINSIELSKVDPSFRAMLFSYVQQTSYLTDDSIKNNILLGIYGKEINFDVLNKAITISELSRFINQLPSGLETNVCERGLALSGGQRQRIALARALYRNTPILILDEATSALDQETETKIIKNISLVEPKKTIIQISHRISSLSNCDLIYKITDGGFLRKYKN